MPIMEMRSGHGHGKRYIAFPQRRQVIVSANQDRFTILGIIRGPRRRLVKTPRPASFVVRGFGMVNPLEFAFFDFVKLLRQKFLIALVRQWVWRRIQFSHRLLYRRYI